MIKKEPDALPLPRGFPKTPGLAEIPVGLVKRKKTTQIGVDTQGYEPKCKQNKLKEKLEMEACLGQAPSSK